MKKVKKQMQKEGKKKNWKEMKKGMRKLHWRLSGIMTMDESFAQSEQSLNWICSHFPGSKRQVVHHQWSSQISSGQFNNALFEYTGIHPNPSVLEWIWVDLRTCLVELHLILILYGNWFSKRSDSVTKSGSLWFFSINSQNHDGESLYIIRRNYFLHLPDS